MTIEHVEDPRLSVRPARPDDAEAIARIQVAGLREVMGSLGVEATRPGAGTPIDEAAVAASWRATLSRPAPAGCHTMVAVHGTAVVGVVACVPGRRVPAEGRRPEIPAGVELIALDVDAAFRRSGHASRMLRAVVDVTSGQGARSIRLWVGAEDEARVRFAQASGCAPAGIQRSLDVAGVPRREHLWWAAIGED